MEHAVTTGGAEETSAEPDLELTQPIDMIALLRDG